MAFADKCPHCEHNPCCFCGKATNEKTNDSV